MQIVRRDIRFALPPERICDWHREGPAVTHLFNALSLKFPAGERFFMDSVRHYRDRITDPELKKQVAGFIGQEAMHTREHVEYNDLLERAGLPAHKIDKSFWTIVKFANRIFSPRLKLAGTMAFEHYTAIFADMVLKRPEQMVGGLPAYQHVWQWHAIEETEHKAVSFDVWNTAIKTGYSSYMARCFAMVLTTIFFWSTLFVYHSILLASHRRHVGKIGFGNMWRLVKFIWAPQGMFWLTMREVPGYFRPGFHPWDHDNRAELAQLTTLLDEVEQSNQAYAQQAEPRRVPLHPGAHAMV